MQPNRSYVEEYFCPPLDTLHQKPEFPTARITIFLFAIVIGFFFKHE